MLQDETKILVTGANGLIGNSICDLLSKGDRPFIAVYRRPYKENNRWKSVVADILNGGLNSITDVIGTVFHCAALIPDAKTGFESCAATNLVIDTEINKFVAERKVKKLVFASTTSIYGISAEPISEETIPKIGNAYARGKLVSEEMFLSLPEVATYCLRINAPYGAHQKHETVLSSFIQNGLASEDIHYHGTGSRCQDFTNAADIAAAFLACDASSGGSGIYNISLGQPISMKELGKLVLNVIGISKSKVLASGLPDPQEIHRAIFDVEKSRKQLRWSAKMSLKEGISDWVSKLSK
jgi:UDP-glucuronate 4-epimerase